MLVHGGHSLTAETCAPYTIEVSHCRLCLLMGSSDPDHCKCHVYAQDTKVQGKDQQKGTRKRSYAPCHAGGASALANCAQLTVFTSNAFWFMLTFLIRTTFPPGFITCKT